MGTHEKPDNGHWITSTKLRMWLYGTGIAASPLAIFYGLITVEEAGLWLTFFGIALGATNALAIANAKNGDKTNGA